MHGKYSRKRAIANCRYAMLISLKELVITLKEIIKERMHLVPYQL
jgi:hypothetical protein